MHRRIFVATALALWLNSTAHAAADEQEARAGVWRGTIGSQAIMACLDRPDRFDANYYYLRHGLGIPLSAVAPDGARWNEGGADQPGAYWELDAVVGDRLEGRWHDADGQRVLPIRLSRVSAPAADGETCDPADSSAAKIAFNAPRVAAQKVTTAPASEGLRQVSTLNGEVSMFELSDEQPAARRFNRAMREWMRDGIIAYFHCRLAAPEGGYSQALQVEWRAGPWLVLQQTYSSDCGGPHSYGGVAGYQTWNLETGERVDPWRWIRGAKPLCTKPAECSMGTLPQELHALLLQSSERSEDDACAGTDLGFVELRPSVKGLVFGTDFAYAARACNEDLELTYAQLLPFLTREGKAAVDSLMRATAAHAIDTPHPGN